ncbi:MAG: hypothetical protein GDA49_07140 [Rhodospirillales bacterium]|nr:hypothetical protein [Rhodospirillales bacterium]
MTAVLGRVVLRETVYQFTWFAMAGALTGIAVMVVGNLGGGNLVGTAIARCRQTIPSSAASS